MARDPYEYSSRKHTTYDEIGSDDKDEQSELVSRDSKPRPNSALTSDTVSEGADSLIPEAETSEKTTSAGRRCYSDGAHLGRRRDLALGSVGWKGPVITIRTRVEHEQLYKTSQDFITQRDDQFLSSCA